MDGFRPTDLTFGRAGLGFHKTLARRLSKALAIHTTVGGALGFTFGSNRTAFTARNEVLIPGIPWIMEYPGSLPVREAEKQTSAREGRTITVAAKKPEIDRFTADKDALEKGMKAIAQDLRSTEVNKALDEIDTRFRLRWRLQCAGRAADCRSERKCNHAHAKH